MALSDSPVKSIGIIVGIALVGAIFIVTTAQLVNRTPQAPVSDSKPYSEPTSGLVFLAPTTWTVGIGTDNELQVRGLRTNDIQTQRSSCSTFAKSSSQSLASTLESGADTAVTLWQKQFTGLEEAQIVKTTGGQFALLGVDTCSSSRNRKVLTFRGQAYRNDVEVRFSYPITVSSDLSAAQLSTLAHAIDSGSADQYQSLYDQFAALIQSLR